MPAAADHVSLADRTATGRQTSVDPNWQVARPTDPADSGLDLGHALRLLRRRWRLAAMIAIVGTLAAIGVLTQLPKTYRAEAMLVLDPRRSKVSELQAQSDGLLSRTQADLSAIRTEAEMLVAPTVLREVVTRLDLADQDDAPSAAMVWLRENVDRIRVRLHAWLPDLVPPSSTTTTEETPERRINLATEAVGRAVSVVNEGGSYTLRVVAQARDPDLAAGIANTVATAYLDEKTKLLAAERDVEVGWLKERVDVLRQAAQENDAAVEAYRTQNQLAQGSATSALDERIADVNRAAISARTRLSGETAILDEARRAAGRNDGQSAPAVLASPAIQELTVQEAVLLGRRSQLQQTLGPRHPAIVEIDGQLAGLRARIATETQRIVAGLQGKVTASGDEVADLKRQLDALDAERQAGAATTVKLAELERQATASREIYAQVLNQYSGALIRQPNATANEVRLVAEARPPLTAAGPDRKILALAGVVASTALGMLVALALGFWRGGFGGASMLERATGLPTLELVPELGRREFRRQWRSLDDTATSVAIRSLAFMLHSTTKAAGARSTVLLVTSSVRGEGKSFCAGHLARSLASLGSRVLLVDLDVWRPTVAATARAMQAAPTEGEIDGVAILSDPITSLDLLPADTRSRNVSSALAFSRRLEAVCGQDTGHDIIVLDAPPVLLVPDVLAAATRADATLLVVRFELTREEAVRSALLRLASVGIRPLGTVLSRVVPGKYRRYGYREKVTPAEYS